VCYSPVSEEKKNTQILLILRILSSFSRSHLNESSEAKWQLNFRETFKFRQFDIVQQTKCQNGRGRTLRGRELWTFLITCSPKYCNICHVFHESCRAISETTVRWIYLVTSLLVCLTRINFIYFVIFSLFCFVRVSRRLNLNHTSSIVMIVFSACSVLCTESV
jgi:hypothetical protein